MVNGYSTQQAVQTACNNKILAYNAHPGQARFQVFYIGSNLAWPD